MLKKTAMLLAAGAFMTLGLALASSAQAFSPAPANMPVDEMAGIEHVAQGCGGGWVRNRYGRCVPVRAYRAYRPAVVCRTVMTPYGWRRICR